MIFGKRTSRNTPFLELFNEHGHCIGRGSQAFMLMVQNYGDENLRAQHGQAVVEAEHAADKVTAEVHRRLHRSDLPPAAREQNRQMANALDDVLDLLQDTTEVMSLYDLRQLTPEAVRLADISVRCCGRVQHLLSLLPRLAEPEVAEAAIKTCEEIDRLESDADRVMRAAMSQLFREEPDTRELIKLKAVYEHLESISDLCEDVANLVQGRLLERF